jgi:endonuclease/exonuclease/phosphatase family metal-dependent hydrolase
MARSRTKSAVNPKTLATALAVFLKLPLPMKIGLVLLALAGGGVFLYLQKAEEAKAKQASMTDGENEFLFCFWNVENLFDDKDDKRNSTDEVYDNPFAENKELRELKYDRIATALLGMNGGRGPDVIACAEVESVRAADLLKATLNDKLKAAKQDDKYQYKHVLMINLDGGRHIAPCVISRVNVDVRNVKQLNKRLRILETHLYVNQKDLCVIVSHWTSQLKQRDGSDGDEGREKYANTIWDRVAEIVAKEPDADFLLCGDYNDTPDAEPVFKNLGAIGDVTKVKPATKDPFLLNLMHGKDPAKYGTLYFGGKPLIYDHIVVSPGMLDSTGWSADPKSVNTYTEGLMRKGATRREPWRFGDPGKDVKDADRGYADHFPVTVKLKVEAAK